MAEPNRQTDEDIIDLTELIESGESGSKKAAAAYAKSASGPAEPPAQEDDFAAILAETGGDTFTKTKASPQAQVNANEQLDMSDMGSIDNLLESLDIPSQPRDASQTGGDALDSVLDDLLGSPAPARPSKAPQPEPAAGTEVQESLDDVAPPVGAARKNSGSSAGNDFDADLDELLGSFDDTSPSSAKAQTAAPRAPSPSPAPTANMEDVNLDAELDDLLADVEPPAPPVSNVTPPAGKNVAAAPVTDSELAKDPLSGELDEMFGGPEQPVASQSPTRSAAARVKEPPAFSSDNAPAPMAVQPEVLAGICQNLAAVQASGTQETFQEFSHQLGAQTARTEDLSVQINQLGKRLFATESKLAAARARIASLEKSVEAAGAIQDLLRNGTPLHTGFMSLISTAVAQALKGFASNLQPDPVMVEQINQLERGGKSINARLELMEKRLDDLEPRFNKEIEKAAASTVARLLNEEIARLAQDQ